MAEEIYVRGPDGQTVTFPPGTTDAVINAEMTRRYTTRTTAPPPEPGALGTVDGYVRAAARGTGIGSFLDEANAFTNASIAGILPESISGLKGNWSERYAQDLALQRAKDKKFDADNPYSSLAAKVAGGIASLPATPVLRTAQGANLATRIGAGLGTGAGYGALYGFGEGEGGVMPRVVEAGKGALIGGGIGAAAPVVAAGVGNIVQNVAERMRPVAPELAPFARGARERVATLVGMDDSAQVAANARKLGPEAIVADLGPNLQMAAGALANQPGAGAQRITDTLNRRAAGAAQRIADTTDNVLGLPQDTHGLVNRMTAQRAADANRLYGDAFNDPAAQSVWSAELAELMKRPAFRRAAEEAEMVAADSGARVINPFVFAKDGSVSMKPGVTPTLQFWHHAKLSLDDAIEAAKRAGEKGRTARLVEMKNRLLAEMDGVSPGYAQARGLYAGQSGVMDAMERGGDAFRRGVDPAAQRAELGGLNHAEKFAYDIGARRAVADTMGEARFPGTAARQAFQSPYSRERLANVVGGPGADRITNRLDAETAFDATRNAVLQNSATARRQATQKMFPTSPETGNSWSHNTATGLTFEGLRRLANMATRGHIESRMRAVGEDASRMLTTGGPARDAMIAALANLNRRQQGTAQGREEVERMIRAIIFGSNPTAVETGLPR